MPEIPDPPLDISDSLRRWYAEFTGSILQRFRALAPRGGDVDKYLRHGPVFVPTETLKASRASTGSLPYISVDDLLGPDRPWRTCVTLACSDKKIVATAAYVAHLTECGGGTFEEAQEMYADAIAIGVLALALGDVGPRDHVFIKLLNILHPDWHIAWATELDL